MPRDASHSASKGARSFVGPKNLERRASSMEDTTMSTADDADSSTMPSSSPSVPTTADVVMVDWNNLSGDSPSGKAGLATALENAYGSSGTGILAIRNVPGFVKAKQAFLPLAHSLVQLPQDYLENNLTDESSLYNAGWSHGKEKLGDKPDLAKASYYYNPVTDTPGTESDRQKYPLSYPCNKWPDKALLPGFEEAATTIGKILKQAVIQLSRHVDALAQSKLHDYPTDFLYQHMRDTDKVKARLLYYYPLSQSTANEDTWIGWHNDSGFFTALAGDLYVNHTTGAVVECPDPAAGLYVVDRQDCVLRVTIPFDCLAVQMGECTQIVTGGTVTATPHCVRGVDPSISDTVARVSLPCFVDSRPDFALSMPASCSRQSVLDKSCTLRVPPLAKRWKQDGMSFGEFLKETFEFYYEWTGANAGKEGEEKAGHTL